MVAGIEEVGSWNLPPPMWGDQNHTVCFKGGSRKCSVVATKILRPPFPQAVNNDRSLRMTETRFHERVRLNTSPKPLCFPKSAGRQNVWNFPPFSLAQKSLTYHVARNFCGSLYFCGLVIFCVLRELIFAIKTDWFFLLGWCLYWCWLEGDPALILFSFLLSTCNRNTYFQTILPYADPM